MRIITGERIGRGAPLVAGCAAIIWDERRERILLTRRSDNGRWCLPGGRMESGESAAEACAREVLEETGLRVRVGRLVGVYTSPDFVIEYADGNRYQIVAMSFEAEVSGGRMESGESAAEACAREVLEETGLRVRVARLVGVYTSPDFVIEYADGNRFQIVAMSFEAEVSGGQLTLTEETTEFGFFTPTQIKSMDLVEHHVQRIADAAANQAAAFVR